MKRLRPDDVPRVGEQNLALFQRLTHQPKLEVLQVAQTAVDELGACRGGGPAKVSRFGQQNREPTAGSIGGDAGTVDASADDYEVIDHVEKLACQGLRRRFRAARRWRQQRDDDEHQEPCGQRQQHGCRSTNAPPVAMLCAWASSAAQAASLAAPGSAASQASFNSLKYSSPLAPPLDNATVASKNGTGKECRATR